jgi:hypothetical protein
VKLINRLKGKKVLITGANSGIGKACAELLLQYEAELFLTVRDKKKLQGFKNATILELDVRDKEQVEAVLADCNPDILINNAGLALGLDSLENGSIDDWEVMIDTNIKGLLYVSKNIFKKMKQKKSGHIINISSIAGKMAYAGGNVYCATKAAVESLSQSMNIDAAGTNIRVSNVAPGAVETNFSTTRFHGDDAKADAVYEGFQALRAEDIAEIVVYVLNAPSHVNIQDLLVMPTAQRNPFVLHRDL